MDHTRHSEIYDLSKMGVTLIGAGGIGAITGIAIAKMGISWIVIYDYDLVDDVNIPVQFHKYSDIGNSKAVSLAKSITEFTDLEAIHPIEERVDQETMLYGNVIISAVDSINARKGIWKAVNNSKAKFYLDARMSAQEFHLYCVDMSDDNAVTKYNEIIINETDDGISDEPCTAKATTFTALFAAGHVCNALKRISRDEKQPFHLINLIKADELYKS